MKRALEKYGSWLSAIVRLHAYAAATFLVIYMVGTITGLFNAEYLIVDLGIPTVRFM